MFHSLILVRRKFGSQLWSRKYIFNDGDLRICGDILHNYLANYESVPYADLQYLFGEVMYGGHITDNWDRRTNNTYLLVLIRPESTYIGVCDDGYPSKGYRQDTNGCCLPLRVRENEHINLHHENFSWRSRCRSQRSTEHYWWHGNAICKDVLELATRPMGQVWLLLIERSSIMVRRLDAQNYAARWILWRALEYSSSWDDQ